MSKLTVAQDGSAERGLIPKRLTLVPGTTTPKALSLIGRFRLMDGALGADDGPWADTSGNGGSATLFLGDDPVRIAAGLQAPADGNGFVIDSNVTITANWTVVATLRTETDDTLPAQIQGWLSPTGNQFPANPADLFVNGNAPLAAMKSTLLGNDDDNSFAIWDVDESEFGASNFAYIPQAKAPANVYNTIAVRFLAAASGGTGHMDIWSPLTNGYNYRRTVALANYYGALPTTRFMFGIWPHGLQRPADGTFCAIDIWGHSTAIGFLDRDAVEAAARSQAIEVAARGVTVNGL